MDNATLAGIILGVILGVIGLVRDCNRIDEEYNR